MAVVTCRSLGSGTVAIGKEERIMKFFELLVSIGTVGMLAGCAVHDMQTLAKAGIKPFDVVLEVIDDGRNPPVLVTKDKKNNKCTKFPDDDKYRKGCIFADLNEVVETTFTLSGSGGWYFTKFWICSAKDAKKPETCSLSAVQMADWVVLANAGAAMPGTDGSVDITQFGTGLRQFTLRDNNWRKDEYFYRVQACSKKSDDDEVVTCAEMDPGSENNGRGLS